MTPASTTTHELLPISSQLHVRIEGPRHAPIILFLHGGGYTSRMWDEAIALLDDVCCVSVDLPGHGNSASVPFVSFEDAAKQVAATMNHRLPGRPYSVVGLSFGGYVGLHLLEQSPSLVERAFLSGFSVIPADNRRLLSVVGTLISPLATTRWFRRLSERSMKIPRGGSMDCWRLPAATNARTLRAIMRGALDHNVPPDRLRQITTPLLAVAGAEEHDAIIDSLAVLRRHAPNARVAALPGLGHAWPAEDVRLFVSSVRAWIVDREFPSFFRNAA